MTMTTAAAAAAANTTTTFIIAFIIVTPPPPQVNVMSSFAVPFEEDERDPNVWYVDHNYIECAPYTPSICSKYLCSFVWSVISTVFAAKSTLVKESSDGAFTPYPLFNRFIALCYKLLTTAFAL
jgi:hypothetical protein